MGVTIEQITIAATNPDKMVAFYNAVLDANLKPFEPFPGATFYSGNFAGIPLTVCPNTVAGVEAKQNRQQFQFRVDNVHDTFVAALNHHGTELTAIEEQADKLICSVYDPDGNSIVFTQAK